jgi:large subunit ribosomal protein L18
MRQTIRVYKSNTGIEAQAVETGKTLVGKRYKFSSKIKPVEEAISFGEDFGNLAKGKKITKIAFDRNGFRYHGRVKAFAEGLRKAGLDF